MKKLLGIVVLSLLWCGNLYAVSQNDIINQHLKNRKLDSIEGIWLYNNGTILGIYKSGSSYTGVIIKSSQMRNGSKHADIVKGSETLYYGTIYARNGSGSGNYKVYGDTFNLDFNFKGRNYSFSGNRIWPNNLASHNSQFKKKKVAKKEKPKKKKSKGASGTAFFITNNGHLITNFHVIEVCKNNSKIILQDKELPVKILAKDALLDLALLKADIKKTNFIYLSKDPPKKLQRIIAAGYPLGKSLSDDLKFTSGIISSLKGLNDDSTLIQIDAALNKGNSGGPIIDEKSGELVAVAVAGLDKSATEAINFGIKTNSVKNFLDSNQLEVVAPSLFSFGVDAADILEKATVYTYCN